MSFWSAANVPSFSAARMSFMTSLGTSRRRESTTMMAVVSSGTFPFSLREMRVFRKFLTSAMTPS